MSTFEDECGELRQQIFERHLKDARHVWIIEERGADFVVHDWSPGGVGPTSEYPTLRKAAARFLQLLRTGVVAPQTWPEEVCIGSIETEEPAP